METVSLWLRYQLGPKSRELNQLQQGATICRSNTSEPIDCFQENYQLLKDIDAPGAKHGYSMDYEDFRMTQIRNKPKLVPLSVPWSVAVDETRLELHTDEAGFPVSATFVGCFRNSPLDDEARIGMDRDSLEFQIPSQGEPARFHFVKVNFLNGLGSGWHQHYSDWENLDLDPYDISDFEGAIRPGESADEAVDRFNAFYELTGIPADPRVYEIKGSSSLRELAADRSDLHHYLFLGSERNLSVIAEGFEWELGQPAP